MTSSTSDNKGPAILKTAFIYLLCTIFCAFFGAVYEAFSFGVFSYYMIYAFAIPLLLGTLPLFTAVLLKKKCPDDLTLNLWNCGTAVLTVGCMIKGVLEIYGTTNRLLTAYPAAGAVFLVSAFISHISKKNNYPDM